MNQRKSQLIKLGFGGGVSSDRLSLSFFKWPEGQRICDNKLEIRDLKSACSCNIIMLHVDSKNGNKQGRETVSHTQEILKVPFVLTCAGQSFQSVAFNMHVLARQNSHSVCIFKYSAQTLKHSSTQIFYFQLENLVTVFVSHTVLPWIYLWYLSFTGLFRTASFFFYYIRGPHMFVYKLQFVRVQFRK